MRDRKSEGIKAHSQHHVIRRIVAVTLAAAAKESDHGLPTEHHPAATEMNVGNIQTRWSNRAAGIQF